MCPSCEKSFWVATSDGDYAEINRCPHCGFQVRTPPPKYRLKSSDFGID